MKNTRSGQGKPMPDEPPPNGRLKSMGGEDFPFVRINPEGDHFRARMRSAEGMAKEGP